jgi:hypothetical protein
VANTCDWCTGVRVEIAAAEAAVAPPAAVADTRSCDSAIRFEEAARPRDIICAPLVVGCRRTARIPAVSASTLGAGA